MIDWTAVYTDAVTTPEVVYKPPEEYTLPPGAKPCRIIPCPGSYFPAHDAQCESFFVEGAYAWTECDCEPRARAVRDAS